MKEPSAAIASGDLVEIVQGSGYIGSRGRVIEVKTGTRFGRGNRTHGKFVRHHVLVEGPFDIGPRLWFLAEEVVRVSE